MAGVLGLPMAPSADPPPERESAPDRVRYSTLPEEIRHANLARLYRHWDGLCGGRAMPRRPDFDPLALPALLGNLILIDVLGRAPLRFRYRLVGSKLTERIGRDMTGRSFEIGRAHV